MMHWLGWLLGIRDLESIHDWRLGFAAPWASQRPALVLFAALILAAATVVFYLRRQAVARRRGQISLITLRTLLLLLLLLCLAEPTLMLGYTRTSRALLVMLFDNTDSMNIADKLSAEDRKALADVVSSTAGTKGPDATRVQLVRRALEQDRTGIFARLARRYRLRLYALDRPDQVRPLEVGEEEGAPLDHDAFVALAKQLQPTGQVTALGSALNDLARRHQGHHVAGVVIFSDFDNNAGPDPLAAAPGVDAPLFTVGLGPKQAVDLSVALQAPLIVKKGEKTDVTVTIRQSGLTGRSTEVQLLARRLGASGDEALQTSATPVGPARPITLDRDQMSVELPFTPDTAGRFVLQARVPPFEDEVLDDNNTAERDITVQDESLKVLFIEYEPTWEWRFIKEVFHRDPLVGLQGFRTFLQSADFKVRTTNPLFLPTLVRPRSEFFSYDVIFLSDVPAEMLSPHFQDMLQEYVGSFGGGLVVISGPRFGPQALANTKIAGMLPVVVDPNAQIRDRHPFTLQLTPQASQYDFMRLGDTPEENQRAWANLGKLPWYQPVLRPHPLATVLAQHPTDKCVDGVTPQPLIAIRRYGKGEVVYFGFDETWRLRRLYGEKYYRQLWGQMMYHLGLSRALGSQKRFQVRTDRSAYQTGDKVRLTVEAYNSDFEPLGLPALSAELLPPAGDPTAKPQEISVPLARGKNIYEVSFPVFTEGSHRVLVHDPVTNRSVEVNFKVAPLTAERRSAVRDTALQQALAAKTGGQALELSQIDRLGKLLTQSRINLPVEHDTRPLWDTWLFLLLGLALMLGEWTLRKLMNLP